MLCVIVLYWYVVCDCKLTITCWVDDVIYIYVVWQIVVLHDMLLYCLVAY